MKWEDVVNVVKALDDRLGKAPRYVQCLAVLALVAAIVLIVRSLDIAVGVVFALLLGSVLGYGSYWTVSEAQPRHKEYAPVVGVVVALVIIYIGIGNIAFTVKIRNLEQEFIRVAEMSDYDIVYEGHGHSVMDYGGRLSEVLYRRDVFLRRWHRDMSGLWWVDTDRGPEVRASYTWVPFGWGLKDP